MDKVIDHFKFTSGKLQPQIFSIALVTLILIIFAIVVYNKVKKSQPNKAPSGILLVAEQYVMGVENQYQNITAGQLQKPKPYIFTLLSFLLIGNLFGLIGLLPPATSYSVTLTLGLISWIGIYVVGLIYEKWRFFKKFLNPIELMSQFAPLISISLRLFGNMIAGSTIMYLLYHFVGWIWGFIPVFGAFNLVGPIIAWPFHIYFDLFSGLIQAIVFSLLTIMYWSLEAPIEERESKKSTKKVAKLKAQRA